jgi:hypothetical protein
MKQISFIKDVLNDSVFAVLVSDKNNVTAFGASPTGSAWAKQCNSRKMSFNDIKNSIDVMLYTSKPKLFTEDEAGSLSGEFSDDVIIQIRKMLDEETKSFKLSIKSDPAGEQQTPEPDSFDFDDEDTRMSVSDMPISFIDIEFKRNAITYKAKAFSLDMQIASMRLEAKGARAIFDPSARSGVGAWRCPPETPYGGQFTNRFGRGCTWGVSRRIGRAFTAFAGQELGAIRRMGESLEGRGDRTLQRAGERSNRRLDRRANRAAKAPARQRVAERMATALESAAGGIRARGNTSASRRAARRAAQPTPKPPKTPKAPKQTQTQLEKFLDSLKKRNQKLSLEDADYLFNVDDPKNGWLVRGGSTDQEWLETIDDIVAGNPDGNWIAIPKEQLSYVVDVSTGKNGTPIDNPNNRDFRKSIDAYKKSVKQQNKKSKRTNVGKSPKKPPLAQRLADRAAAKASAVRDKKTTRKMRGRKPRSTDTRRERAARLLSRVAQDVATGTKKPKDTSKKSRKSKKNNRAKRRDVSMANTNTAKFFAKTGIAKLMPDMSTLTQQQQDDVRAAVRQAYEKAYDLQESRVLDYIERYKTTRRPDAKTRKFKSKPGSIDLDEVIEATQQSGIIDGWVLGAWNNDAHNFQVLAEIINNDDYSLVDELKPSKRDAILQAAGVVPPPKRSRKKKTPPAAPPAAPPASPPASPPTPPPTPAAPPTPPPTPAAPPTPPPTPVAPPTPVTPPTPPKPANPPTPATPPAPPTPPTPPPVPPLPPKPKAQSANDADTINFEDATPVDQRDMSIDGVEPSGTMWRDVDVSGFIRVERIRKEPLFRDPATNRFIDFSEAIVVDSPLDTIAFSDYPKAKKSDDPKKVIAYPKKRANFKGKNQDREMFPGTSDKAFESWDEVIVMWDKSVAGHDKSVHGFKTIQDLLTNTDSGFDPESDEVMDGAVARRLQSLIDVFNRRAIDSSWNIQRDIDDMPAQVLATLRAQLDTAEQLIGVKYNTINGSPGVTFAELNLPDWFIRLPVPSNPWDETNTGRTSYIDYWLSGATSRYGNTSNLAHNKITAYMITRRASDLIAAFDTASQTLAKLQTDMDNQLRSWRGGNKSQVIPRRIAQLGFEIEALERFINEYFSDGAAIADALQKRERSNYQLAVLSANKARERAERRASGELKVGGKLTPEDLAPKPGVVRDDAELQRLLLEHKSPQLINEANSTPAGVAVPPLTQDEVDFYDQVQNAYLTKTLPNGKTVEEHGASGSTSDASIAELHMTLELNGYNDAPLQLSDEEFENALKERDDEGNPLWHFMSRYLNPNSSRPELTPDMMVEEYRQGERWPIGGGGQAGGRGDNFQGGSGLTYYGPSGIGALVSARAKVADRQWLDDISDVIKDVLRDASTKRHVATSSSITYTGQKIDDDELMQLVDNLKTAMMTNRSYSSLNGLSAGDPRYDEAVSIASMAIEHWLQLELSKISGAEDELNPEDKDWNERLLRMQQSIFNMDEAQVAVYAGYDGYFTNRQPFMRDRNYSNADWSKNTDKNMNNQQVIWLNRTALAVLGRSMTHSDASRYSQ